MKRIEVLFVDGKAKSYECHEWYLDEDNMLSIERDESGERQVCIHQDYWISVEDF